MSIEPESLAAWLNLPCDALVDVRSPAEFAEDHVPGAVNFPALSDDERKEVGTVYVQESRFRARRMGAAMMARNLAGYLEGPMVDWPGSHKLLVYCWRGGQRSDGFAEIIRRVGWRVNRIEGGYRGYRRFVASFFYGSALPLRIILLDGNTGVAKTELIRASGDFGTQVIDLEALARHRGSVFGGLNVEQPSQKAFETILAASIIKFDPTRPVLVEAESSRIGRLTIPPALWATMRKAPRIAVEAPLVERIRYIMDRYSCLVENPRQLDACLNGLIAHHSADRIRDWRAKAEAGNLNELVEDLINRHYDPNYRRGRKPIKRIHLQNLDQGTIAANARNLNEFLNGLPSAARTQ